MPALSRPITLDLSPSRGPWVALGHGQAPPRVPRFFSPPKFTPEQQAANPDQQMTRVVKDVLRVGRWKVGVDATGKPEMWAVDHATLRSLANAHRESVARGVAMNLTKSHGDLLTGIVPTDELIAPVDEVIIENGVLWVSCYVNQEQSRYLSNRACKVSPGIWPDWIDGHGNKYPIRMLHVAVTDNPVIPGQGPFVPMANQQKPKGRTMDFAALVEQINALLEKVQPGLKLPEDVTEETINLTLSVLVSALGGSAPDADDDGGDLSGAGSDAGIPASGMGMSNRRPVPAPTANAPPPWAREMIGQMRALSNTVATLQAGHKATAQQTFTDRVIALANAGVPAKEVERLTKVGRQYGWDLSLLPAAVEDIPGTKVPQGGKAKALANAAPPKISDAPERPSDEDCRKAAEKHYGVAPRKA